MKQVVKAIGPAHDGGYALLGLSAPCPRAFESKSSLVSRVTEERLENIPREIIERDYGCRDPSRYLRSGETADLRSGGGKICYIASQVVGPTGRVIGVDMNDEMLSLANRYREEFGRRIGYHNVRGGALG